MLEKVYRQYVELRRAGIEPVEVRIGAEDYYDLVKECPPYTGPLLPIEQRLFGVPIKRLPIPRVISFR